MQIKRNEDGGCASSNHEQIYEKYAGLFFGHVPETRSFISGSHLALKLLEGFSGFDINFLNDF